MRELVLGLMGASWADAPLGECTTAESRNPFSQQAILPVASPTPVDVGYPATMPQAHPEEPNRGRKITVFV